MSSPRPQPTPALADARRVALVSVLAYVTAVAVVAASLPVFLATLHTSVEAATPLRTVARVPATYAPEPPR